MRSEGRCGDIVSDFLENKTPTAEQAVSFARRYVGEKFLTETPPQDEESLYALGRAGYRKLKRLQADGSLGDEWNTGCSGASSAMVRKVLFFMALQRDIRCEIKRDEIERAETVGDVAALCVKYCCKG